MSETLCAARGGLRLAMAFTLPLTLWLSAQAWLLDREGAAGAAGLVDFVPVCLLLQALALAVFTPWFLRYPSGRAHSVALAMPLLVPLPLYVVAWAAGAVEVGGLLRGCALLLVLAAALYAFYRGVNRLPAGEPRALAVLGSQFGFCLLLWYCYPGWSGGLPW